MRKKITISFVLLFCCFLAFLAVNNSDVVANRNHKISGYAWSENIGWLSLNCFNEGINNKCLQSDYGLDFDKQTGELFGWAWSENDGWVCFGKSCLDSSLNETPVGGEPFARISEHGLISGWGNWINLQDQGWFNLQGEQIDDLPGQKHACQNCAVFKDESRETCEICFADKDDEGQGLGAICQNCQNCSSQKCENCESCYDYGTGIDYSDNSLVGWAWGENGNNTGFGWLSFQPHQAAVSVHPPYVETVGGDIYAQEGLGSLQQGITPEDKFNATYMLQSDGSIVHFSSLCEDSDVCSDSGWVSDRIGALNLPDQESNYQSELGPLDIKGLLAGQYGEVMNISNSSQVPYLLGGKVYYAKDDLVLYYKYYKNGIGDKSGAGTIVVRGDLHIKSNQYYQSSAMAELKNLASVGYIVLKKADGTGGNIYIDSNVKKMVGNYFTEGEIYTGSKGESAQDWPLKVQGLMVAKKFNFERRHSNLQSQAPAEKVIYQGRVISNPPPGFTQIAKALPFWVK